MSSLFPFLAKTGYKNNTGKRLHWCWRGRRRPRRRPRPCRRLRYSSCRRPAGRLASGHRTVGQRSLSRIRSICRSRPRPGRPGDARWKTLLTGRVAPLRSGWSQRPVGQPRPRSRLRALLHQRRIHADVLARRRPAPVRSVLGAPVRLGNGAHDRLVRQIRPHFVRRRSRAPRVRLRRQAAAHNNGLLAAEVALRAKSDTAGSASRPRRGCGTAACAPSRRAAD